LSRSRILKKIETLDEAVKAERDVESGYHRVIDDHISHWIAVEEGIIESYSRLVTNTDDPHVKRVLESIVADSRRHAQMLRGVSDTLGKIMADEEKHAKLIQALADETRNQ